MMSLSLFEQYEIHRKAYTPGIIWKAKNIDQLIIYKLEIVPQEFAVENPLYQGGYYSRYEGKNVYFRVISCSPIRLNVLNCLYSWPTGYMEDLYVPLLKK